MAIDPDVQVLLDTIQGEILELRSMILSGEFPTGYIVKYQNSPDIEYVKAP